MSYLDKFLADLDAAWDEKMAAYEATIAATKAARAELDEVNAARAALQHAKDFLSPDMIIIARTDLPSKQESVVRRDGVIWEEWGATADPVLAEMDFHEIRLQSPRSPNAQPERASDESSGTSFLPDPPLGLDPTDKPLDAGSEPLKPLPVAQPQSDEATPADDAGTTAVGGVYLADAATSWSAMNLASGIFIGIDLGVERHPESPSNRDVSADDKASSEVGPQAEASLAGTGTETPADREGRTPGEAASADLPTLKPPKKKPFATMRSPRPKPEEPLPIKPMVIDPASQGSAAQRLADVIARDLPDIMIAHPRGLSVSALADRYKAPKPRVNDALRELVTSRRARLIRSGQEHDRLVPYKYGEETL